MCRSAKELILQPQSEVSKVREYVRNTGYKIVDEDMILEDGKYYPMFRCVPCADNSAWDNMDETTVTVCDLYGPVLIKNGKSGASEVPCQGTPQAGCHHAAAKDTGDE